MNLKQLYFVVILTLMFSCHNDYNLTKIEGKRIEINDSLTKDAQIEDFITPYRAYINKNLDSVLAYAPKTYSKKNGILNTAIGNFMADAVFEESQPVFKKRTGKSIDFVLLNYGGIRSVISKGPITKRTAFQVMPFENSVVVVALKGSKVLELANYLATAKRAHPVSQQFKLVLDENFDIADMSINGSDVDEDRMYYIATNDYLYNGGDSMSFFQPNSGVFNLDYKIRNVLIDHFIKNDTIEPKIDDRFIQINR